MPGTKQTASLPLKLFLTVNAIVVMVTVAGLGIDVVRQYRSYHRLLYDGLAEDARLWQQAWIQDGRRTGAFLRLANAVHDVTSETDSLAQFLTVVRADGPGDPPGWQAVVSIPAQIPADVRQVMLTRAGDEHAMLPVGNHRLMIVTVPLPAAAESVRGVRPDQRMVLARYVDDLYDLIRREIYSRAATVLFLVLWVMVIINLLLSRWVARPVRDLVRAADSLGRGNYADPIPTEWGTGELNRLAGSFENAREQLLLADRARQANLDRARRTQRALLPRLDGPIRGVEVAALYRPADQVGGDLYDLFQMPDGAVLAMIGDPAGHGIAASLMMAMVKMDLNHLVALPHAGPGSLQKMAEALDRDIRAASQPGDFVTFLVVQITPGGGPARCLNAGHVPGRLIRADGRLELLGSTGPLIGPLDDGQWAELSLTLRPGDRLALLTDGLLDLQGPAGEPFGSARFDDLLAGCRGMAPAAAVEHIEAVLTGWASGPADDDITVLIVDCGEIA